MDVHPERRRARRVAWLVATTLLIGTVGLHGARADPVEPNEPDLPPLSPVETWDVDEDPAPPCTLVRVVGDRPDVSFDPLLGMFEVDPDHCVQREVQQAVGTAEAVAEYVIHEVQKVIDPHP